MLEPPAVIAAEHRARLIALGYMAGSVGKATDDYARQIADLEKQKIPIAHAAPPTRYVSRFRALALLDAGPQERGYVAIPASKNLHNNRRGKVAYCTHLFKNPSAGDPPSSNRSPVMPPSECVSGVLASELDG